MGLRSSSRRRGCRDAEEVAAGGHIVDRNFERRLSIAGKNSLVTVIAGDAVRYGGDDRTAACEAASDSNPVLIGVCHDVVDDAIDGGRTARWKEIDADIAVVRCRR